MQTYAVTLRPKGSCLGPLSSQRIFGAVCWALDALRLPGVEVSELLAQFSQAPRFVFSSAFPFVEGPRGCIRFFPKPALAPATMEQIHNLAAESSGRDKIKQFKKEVKTISAEAKSIKKAVYVSAGLFAKICAGQLSDLALTQVLGVKVEKVGDALWLKQERQQIWDRTDKPDSLWKKMDVQRNAIDRVAGTTAGGLLFHESQTFYHPRRAGLWFIVRAEAEAWPWLEAAFRYLADTGLGGKRTVGKGHFDFECQAANELIPTIDSADSFISLSQYLPRFEQNQIEAEPRSYTLLIIRKKAENKFPGREQMRDYTDGLHLFAEGSIFALSGKKQQPVYGCLAPLGQVNGHPVYYNGLALPVFAKLGGML